MVFYDADLKESGVEALDGLFGGVPYHVQKSPHTPYTTTFIDSAGRKLPIFFYDVEKIYIRHGIIENLPPAQIEDIKGKLSQVKSLVGIVREEL